MRFLRGWKVIYENLTKGISKNRLYPFQERSSEIGAFYLPPVIFTTLSFMKSVPLYIALLANNASVLVIVFSS